MRHIILLTAFTAALTCHGQSIPYSTLDKLNKCAQELQKEASISASLKISPTLSFDNRSYEVTLITPSKAEKITINPDGTFRLPKVAERDYELAHAKHSLERGALRLSLQLSYNGKLPATNTKPESIYDLCNKLSKPMAGTIMQLEKIEKEIPEIPKTRIHATGVYLPREKPIKGFALLKKEGKTVSTINLSDTGKASWPFEIYNPKEHSIEFNTQNDSLTPNICIEMIFGETPGESKNSITFRP